MAKIRRNRNHTASRLFTDREEFQQTFWNGVHAHLEAPIEERLHRVLVFYGVGGIGKTSLQRELTKQLLNARKPTLHARIDFGNLGGISKAKTLITLAHSFKENHQVSFPHFEISYSLYFAKKNPDLTLKNQEMPYLKDIGFVGNLLAAVDGLGFLGALSGVVERAYGMVKRFNLNSELKEDLKRLERLSPDEIEDEMASFFAYDLEYACERDQSVPIIFVDTYEVLWNKTYWNNDVYPDKFMRDIVELMPFALFVVSSREKLKWQSLSMQWQGVLDQHLLGNLSRKDAKGFLRSCGIHDEKTQDRIYISSNGHPFHMDLCVDQYHEMLNKGIAVEAHRFTAVNSEILERFLMHLDHREVEILKLMSIPRWYDAELFEELASAFMGSRIRNHFEGIQRFSFVESEGNRFFFHALMRENLSHQVEDGSLLKAHGIIFEYYMKRLGRCALASPHDYIESLLSECCYHFKAYAGRSKNWDWLDSEEFIRILQLLQVKGSTNFLISLIADMHACCDNVLNIRIRYILMDMFHLQGNYEDAVKQIGDALKEDHADDVNLQLEIRRLHHQMFYLPVEGIIKEAKRLVANLDGTRYAQHFRELLFMIGGNLGILNGNFDDSRKWLLQAIRQSKKAEDVALLARCLRKYVDMLRRTGHTKFATHACRLGLKLAREEGLRRYEIYLLCTEADLMRETGKLKEAQETIDLALKYAVEQQITGWIGHCYLVLAELAIDTKNDGAEARRFFAEAMGIYEQINQVWGVIQARLGLERVAFMMEGHFLPLRLTAIRDLASNFGYRYETAYINNTLSNGYFGIYRYAFL